MRPNILTLNETCQEQRNVLTDYLTRMGYAMNMVATSTRDPFVVDGRPCTNFGNAVLVRGAASLPSETLLQDYAFEDRKLTCVNANLGIIAPIACVTHLVPRNEVEFRKDRKQQIEKVAITVNPLTGGAVLLGGDFNTTPMEPTPPEPPPASQHPRMLDPIYDQEGGFGHFIEAHGGRTRCDPDPPYRGPQADQGTGAGPCGTYSSTTPGRKIDYLFLDNASWVAAHGHTSPPVSSVPRSDHLLLKGYAAYDAPGL